MSNGLAPRHFLAACAAVACWALLTPAVRSQEPAPCCGERLTAERLLRMSCRELEDLYRQAEPGPVPCGYYRGTTIFHPGTAQTVPRSRATGLVWQGKYFDGCRIENKVVGLHTGPGQVSCGTSWLDGRPSITLDYPPSSKLFAKLHDELRQVAPGVYLAIAYRTDGPCPRVHCFFVLEREGCCR
jgi:hypothetical protein